jgi:spore germination protein
VVQRGDTIFSIAQKYGISPDEIVRENQWPDPNRLVVGQSLIIPTPFRRYTVRAGDSLYTIARRFNVTPEAILSSNPIPAPYVIYPGQVLIIPSFSKMYGKIDVNAYIEPATPDRDIPIVESVAPHLTYLSIFSYRVKEDASLEPPQDDRAVIRTALDNKIAPMMVITNFSEGNFSPEIASAILTSRELQDKLFQNVLSVMKDKGFRVLNIDFERIKPEQRNLYNRFLRRITDFMHQNNILVSTALAPKASDLTTGAWHGAHDYAAHGQIVDFVIIMTYEWGWSGGPPRPVSPLPEVEKVIRFAVSQIPSRKIMMGMNLYGYDWTLPYVEGGKFARAISPQTALQIALNNNAAIQYDQEAKAPFFTYWDGEGNEHIVWFEDARSVRARFNLVKKYGLKGVSYWVLGHDFPQNWLVLENLFTVNKFV